MSPAYLPDEKEGVKSRAGDLITKYDLTPIFVEAGQGNFPTAFCMSLSRIFFGAYCALRDVRRSKKCQKPMQ